MKIFISYSFRIDEIITYSLIKAIKQEGHEPFEDDTFIQQSQCVTAEGDDRFDLNMTFRRAGFQSSTQERSDPLLFNRLVEVIADYDVFLILWSQNYNRRYWTRIEWKTALAMCKPIIIVKLDNTMLDSDLERAVKSGWVPVVEFNCDFRPSKVLSLISKLNDLPTASCMGEVWDERIHTGFIALKHPFLGSFDIGKFEVTIQDLILWAPNLVSSFANTSINERLPASEITWEQAVDICKSLSMINDRFFYRLPTEIEWEFAARAGELSVSGLPDDNFTRYAVLSTHEKVPVGSKAPNVWGIYDMVGNVLEWTLDTGQLLEYNGWVQPVEGTALDRAHIVRGCWFGGRPGHIASVSYPFPHHNNVQPKAIGMRLVRTKNKMEGYL